MRSPCFRRARLEKLEERMVLAATFQEAGITQLGVDAIHASQYASTILADETLQNALDAIAATETAPGNATVLTSVADLSQITAGTVNNPNVYLIQGDLTITSNIEVPSNVHIYVDGSIFKQGSFTAPGGVHSVENGDDAIFMIDGTDNIKLIGIDNALLHSNPNLAAAAPHATAVYIGQGSRNIEVNGFEIANVWEGLVARGFNEDVQFLNNHIHGTVGRAIWSIASQNLIAAHNFIVNAGVDGLDWDAFTNAAVGYENVVIGAGRWAGFVEEAAHDSYFIRGLSLIVDLGNPNRGFMLGWADNGTTINVVNNSGQQTRDNYFIDNVVFDPGNIPQSGGDYFAKANSGGKGQTYFWANRGYGAGQSANNFDNSEWLDFLPTAGGKNNAINAVQLLADLDAQFNVPTPGDFNRDRYVDAEDLLQWQSDYGLNADSDADQDGDTDGNDFLSWQINYSPAPPPMDIEITILDTDYTTQQGYSNGNLANQQGWLGQSIAQISTSGSGTVTSNGGPWDRNMFGNGARGGGNGNPSSAGFNANDELEITFDYQFNLTGNVNTSMANVGIRNEGPRASNGWEAAPQQGFQLEYFTANGGELRIFPDLTDSSPADALVISASDVGIGPSDFNSDELQIVYQVNTDGAGTWTVQSLVLENLTTGVSYTYEGPTQTFSYAASDAFFAQQLAPNGNSNFSGITDGVKFIYRDPIEQSAVAASSVNESIALQLAAASVADLSSASSQLAAEVDREIETTPLFQPVSGRDSTATVRIGNEESLNPTYAVESNALSDDAFADFEDFDRRISALL